MADITDKAGTEIIDTNEFDDSPNMQTPSFGGDTQLSSFAAPQQEQSLFPLKERFAAWLIDSMIAYICYWPAALFFRQLAFQDASGSIPLFSVHGLVFHGLFLLVLLFANTFLTGLFGATPGKWICGLRVQRVTGQACGLVPALIRSLLLPFDLLCFLLFFGLIFLEKSPLKQRFGDRLAKTYVLGLSQKTEYYQVSSDLLASATGRTCAGLIDLAFMLAFAFGYALFLSSDVPAFSMLLLMWFPALLLFGISLLSTLSQSSPGKALFGYIVCHEDGSRVRFASSLVRNLLRCTDLFLFGFLSMLISNRKQRLGDIAAGTIVIQARRTTRAFVGLLSAVAVIALMIFVGNQQRSSFLNLGSHFKINFLPSFEGGSHFFAASNFARAPFGIQELHFTANREETDRRSPPIYKPGETVYIFFNVAGYSRKENFAWLSEDIIVRYPDNSEALKLENAIEYREKSDDAAPVQMVNNFALAPNAQTGRYSVSILLRDRHSKKELQDQRFFYVNP